MQEGQCEFRVNIKENRMYIRGHKFKEADDYSWECVDCGIYISRTLDLNSIKYEVVMDNNDYEVTKNG